MRRNQYIVIVPGYGIPEDILTDLNYNIYLRVVMNHVYDLLISDAAREVVMILCGGYTDMRPPFRRTEASEMKRFLRTLLSRAEMNGIRKRMNILLDTSSRSTFENVWNAKLLLDQRGICGQSVTVCCEKTRTGCVKWITKRMFPSVPHTIVPVDFDQSANRYRDPDIIRRRERLELRMMEWALESHVHHEAYRRLFAERIRRLRKAGSAGHVEAVHAWWQETLEQFEGKELSG